MCKGRTDDGVIETSSYPGDCILTSNYYVLLDFQSTAYHNSTVRLWTVSAVGHVKHDMLAVASLPVRPSGRTQGSVCVRPIQLVCKQGVDDTTG